MFCLLCLWVLFSECPESLEAIYSNNTVHVQQPDILWHTRKYHMWWPRRSAWNIHTLPAQSFYLDTANSITFHRIQRLVNNTNKGPWPIIGKLEHWKHKTKELKGTEFFRNPVPHHERTLNENYNCMQMDSCTTSPQPYHGYSKQCHIKDSLINPPSITKSSTKELN